MDELTRNGPENHLLRRLSPTSGARVLTPRFGLELPYGAILTRDGVQFMVFSRNARKMRILLYANVKDTEPAEVISLDSELHRWGDVWSIQVQGLKAGAMYHYQVDGPFAPHFGMRFQSSHRLIDPFAKAVSGEYLYDSNGTLVPPKCVVVDEEFDWQGDRHLRLPLSDSVIYEMHVRGFTQSPTSECRYPGTYRGVIEKIPYLKSLGVTAVELMPVHEYMEYSPPGKRDGGRENYWGYDPVAFFAPHQGYAWDKTPGGQVREFKEMVRELHKEGIEVILDVVFNHTAEGNENGPVLSFKGLENSVYYMLENDQRFYKNYTGCGNTVNGNHPITRELIFNCLRHWVHNYHVDGFRFDLASILNRDREGNLMPNTPVVEMTAEDPLLADTKIIAEAWDAVGAYQVGSFGGARWAEWNGRYRDDVRRYWRGDPGMTAPLATRLAGSSDLYEHTGRLPYNSINFITAHDGFTMNDLVSYNGKHNAANGENGRDGENNNHSWNFGQEGETRNAEIQENRKKQIKNMIATLLFSQGVPMLLMGDECRRTQRGNNNAYCQNNDISWLNWKMVTAAEEDLLRFYRTLVEFRKAEPALRHRNFLAGQPFPGHYFPDISWFQQDGKTYDWVKNSRTLVCLLAAIPPQFDYAAMIHHAQRHRPLHHRTAQSSVLSGLRRPHHPPLSAAEGEMRTSSNLLMVFHSGPEPVQVTVPPIARIVTWRQFINTAVETPRDVYPNMDGPILPPDAPFLVEARSFQCYLSLGEPGK